MEVNRTRPAERRRQGKTDQLNTDRAARSVSTGEASTDTKDASIEPLRALNVMRRSAVKAQQAAWRQIGALRVNAPAGLRDRYRDLLEAKLVANLTNTRPNQQTTPDLADTVHVLRARARPHRDLGREIADIEARMAARVTAANPALLAMKGIGPVISAQLLITAGANPGRPRSSASFAALCGTAPIPVSSGRTDLSYDPKTRAYRDAHLAKGWTPRAVFRALKRAVACEVFQALVGHCTVPNYSDLRSSRRAKNLILTAAAQHLGVWPARVGKLELGRRPNEELATRYRAWLDAA